MEKYSEPIKPEEITEDSFTSPAQKGKIKRRRESASDRIGRLEIKVRLQKALIVFLFVSCLALFFADIYLARLPKSLPYVIELTPQGEATYYPDAVKLLDSWEPNDATQRFFIADYITKMRSVSIDNYINRQNAQAVYSRTVTSGNAISFIENFFTNNNPLERSKSVVVKIPAEELSILKYSATQWKVVWRETETKKGSSATVLSDKQYEALISIAFYTPRTEREKRENPIGLYVTDFDMDILRDLL